MGIAPILSRTRPQEENPDPNPETRRARGGRRAATRREGDARDGRCARRARDRVRNASSVSRGHPRGRPASRRASSAPAASRREIATSREMGGCGTHRHDGEAGVRDARRGGGRAELGAVEGAREGEPRHVEKTRHVWLLCVRLRERSPECATCRHSRIGKAHRAEESGPLVDSWFRSKSASLTVCGFKTPRSTRTRTDGNSHRRPKFPIEFQSWPRKVNSRGRAAPV